MTGDAIFRIYSMSKPITSVAAMILFEEGKLALNDPCRNTFHSWVGSTVGVGEAPTRAAATRRWRLVPSQRDMTIQDFFATTSGLTYGFTGSSLVKNDL